MRIKLQGFTGEIPRTEPHFLPEQAAAEVMNASLRRGTIQPFYQQSAPVHSFPSSRVTMYLQGTEWLGWDHDADCVPGPVAEDRLYITHANGQPTIRVSGEEMPLAIPNPTTRPNVALVGTLDPDEAESVAYAYTWVTSLGEETGPSRLSAALRWSPNCTVTVSGMPTSAPVANRLISGKRIYRALTSATGATDLYFVAEIGVGAGSYSHDIDTDPIQEAITTKDFDPPPTTLRGLTAMPNGMMAGFRGKELWFCEPYQPHAWPSAYVLTTNDFIVGLAAFGTTLAIMTAGMPYIVQGLHPDSMAMEKVEQPLPCLAKMGIVDMGYSAIYPSTEGLVMISQSGAQVISQGLWTREQWMEMQPTTFRAGRFGSLYGFSFAAEGGASRRLAFVDPAAPANGVIRSNEIAANIYAHIESGDTFLLATNNLDVRRFDDRSQAKKSYTWRSKPYRLPVPTSFGAIRVETDGASGETVTANIYADGNLFHSTASRDQVARMPAGKFRNWQIELTGNATVLSIAMGQTPMEVAS